MFLVDANVMINAARTYYGFDLAPGFWDWFLQQIHSENIASVQAVFDELKAGTDQLAEWAKQEVPTQAWRLPGQDAWDHMATLVNWAAYAPVEFYASAQTEFARSADLFLTSQAAELEATLVTFERSNPASKRRVLIPDAAAQVGVQFVDPFTMFRTLGLTLTV